MTGPCGFGKTYIALGHQACLKDYRTRYYRVSRLMLAFKKAKSDGINPKQLKKLADLDLLILND